MPVLATKSEPATTTILASKIFPPMIPRSSWMSKTLRSALRREPMRRVETQTSSTRPRIPKPVSRRQELVTCSRTKPLVNSTTRGGGEDAEDVVDRRLLRVGDRGLEDVAEEGDQQEEEGDRRPGGC